MTTPHADAADWRYSVSGAAMLGMVRFAEALGTAGPGLTAGFQPGPEAWTDPECRMKQGDYHLLWERATAGCPLPAPGLTAAEALDLDSFGVVVHLAAGAATFGQALAQIERYGRLLHDAGRIEVVPDGANARMYPGCRDVETPTPRHIAEFGTGSVVTIGRQLTGTAWKPLAVQFRHEAPADVTPHERLFGVRPTFGQAETYLTLAPETLALPVQNAQASLVPFLEAFAARALDRLPAPVQDLQALVKRQIAILLVDEALDAAAVAKALGMHERTLRRHLAAAGTSFAATRDAVRLEQATAHLAAGRLAIADIAYLLGYADPANFHRAFKRWTGQAPSAYRAVAGTRG